MRNYKNIFITCLLFVCTNAFSEKNASSIYHSAKQSIISIVAYDKLGAPSSLGSGFFIEDNKIATNYHVVKGASTVVYKHIGESAFNDTEQITSYSESLDIAIIKTKKKEKPLTLSKSKDINVGEEVIAIANPMGLDGSISKGIVSAIRGTGEYRYYKTTVPISPGSSGAPLFDNNGIVVGITTSKLKDSQNLNFAIPSELITILSTKSKAWEPEIGEE